MEFWSLLMVASMPVLQVLLVGLLGAFLASGYINILSANARSDINKVRQTIPIASAFIQQLNVHFSLLRASMT